MTNGSHADTQVTAYAIVGEMSATRLRAKSVGLARNLYIVFSMVGGILNTYQVNATAWNWKGRAGFFWVSAEYFVRRRFDPSSARVSSV